MIATLAKTLKEIKLSNTLTRKKEIFKPFIPGKVSFYSCGPTVYNLIHVGNLRGAIIADLVFRVFKYFDYQIVYVRNYTDIDDKIIQKAKEEGVDAQTLAKKYIQEVEKDFALAGLLEPTHKTKVTEHLPEIISMIEKLIQNHLAYVSSDGEVLYSINHFSTYGKLSHKKIEDLIAGIRVEVSSKKQNPLDFTLWKPAKSGEPSWPSPWGAGRPGWHIECSAMSSKWLGDQMDLHHGGEDLIFPHHENEIAQSEGASGKEPFVKIWIHHAFVTHSQEKMSKSLGNVFLAREFLTRFGGEVARFFLLSAHYRSPIDFTDQGIDQALTSLERIYEAKALALKLLNQKRSFTDLRAENLWSTFIMDCEKTKKTIQDAYANDLNTPEVLGAFFSLIREFNRILNEPLAQATSSVSLAAEYFLKILDEEIGNILGIGKSLPEKMFSELKQIRQQKSVLEGTTKISVDEIEKLIEERNSARKIKNFGRADEIRKTLDAQGIVLKDDPNGKTFWSYK